MELLLCVRVYVHLSLENSALCGVSVETGAGGARKLRAGSHKLAPWFFKGVQELFFVCFLVLYLKKKKKV